MAEAQSLYEASSPNVSLSVSPYFREDVLKRGNTRRVAERLAKLVAQIAPAAPTDGQAVTIVRADWDALDHAGLGEVLVDLTVLRLPGTSRTLWPPPVGGYLNTDVGSIERRIREKEEDLPLYKATVDECWLIIYAPLMHASSFFDIDGLTPDMFASDFHRVAYLDIAIGRYVLVA